MSWKPSFLGLGLTAIVASAGCEPSATAGTGGGGAGGTHSQGGQGQGGSLAGFTDCTTSSQCIVIPASCCGSCGAATRDDAVAVNAAEGSAYLDLVCAGVAGCPGCYMMQDPTLVATCDEGTCVVVDLHEHPSAACDSHDDCRIRTHDCCECGGDVTEESLIAINQSSEASFAALVCDAGTGCPECLPVYPAGAVAQCHPDGYCEVVWTTPDGG